MARPVAPTPPQEGEAARYFWEEMARIDRCEFTAEEIAFRKRLMEIERFIPFGE